MNAVKLRAKLDRQAYAAVPIGLLVVLLIVAAFRGPDLFTSRGGANALANMAPLIMATLALTSIAIAGRGGVDLAIGPLLSLVNVLMIKWLVDRGVTSPVPLIAFALAIAIVYELIQGILIATLRLQPIIVTLAGFLVLGGLNLTIMEQPGGAAPSWLAHWGSPSSIFSPVLLVIAIALVVWVLIARTTFFRNIRLMGANERTAYASGVPLIRARLGAHVIAGIYAGLGGLLYTALIASGDPTFGTKYTLMVVTALLLGGISVSGGRGGALGAVVGAVDVFLISYVLATFNFGSSATYAVQLAYGLVLVAALGAGVLFAILKTRRARREAAVEVVA
jgi:ribose transport system permease protein